MSDRANIADAYRQLGASRKQLNRRTSCVAAADFFQHNPPKATERSGKINNTITLKTPVGNKLTIANAIRMTKHYQLAALGL